MSTPFLPGTTQHQLLDSAVSELVDIDREIRGLEARKMERLAQVRRIAQEEADATIAQAAEEGRSPGCEHSAMTHRAAEAEVAFALRLSDRAVARQMDHADRVVTGYPAVHASLADGRITTAHTAGIVDAGLVIQEAAVRQAYETEVLAYAEQESPNRTRKIAKTLAEKHAHRTFAERHATAREQRLVAITDLDDGMAELRAIMDATSAHAALDRLCQQARLVQDAERAAALEAKRAAAAGTPVEAPGVRPLDLIRADLAADLLLNGVPSNDLGEIDLSRIQARVQVTVPVLSLLPDTAEGVGAADGAGGINDAEAHRSLGVAGLQGAATLAGYGPIDTATTRLLAGLQAGWDRIGCHPLTGDVLSVDRYRPSAEIRRFIIARDQQCRFSGCIVVAHRADQDHTIDAAHGGATSTANLAIACRRHHVMKHHTGITVTQSPGGVLEWVSVLGRKLRDTPVSWVMFRPIAEASGSGSGPHGSHGRIGSCGPPGSHGSPRAPERRERSGPPEVTEAQEPSESPPQSLSPERLANCPF